jgi:hypothetical protein
MFEYGEAASRRSVAEDPTVAACDVTGSAGSDIAARATSVAGTEVTEWCQGAADVARLEWTTLDGDARLELVRALHQVSSVVRGALAAGLAAVDDAQTAQHASGLSVGGWWSSSLRSCGGEGAWLARAGHLMACFPSLGAAIRAGEISVEHLRAVDGITDPEVMARLVGLDAELCTRARRLTLAEWRRSLRATVAALRAELEAARRREVPDRSEATDRCEPAEHGASDSADHGTPPGHTSEEEAAGAEPARDLLDLLEQPADDDERGAVGWLTCRTTTEGSLLLRGELVGHAAEVFRQALSAEASRRRRAAWREHDAAGIPMPHAGELRAEALLELVRRGTAADPTSGPSARTEAIVVVHADDAAAERICSLDGEPLGADVAALLTCDAHLQALVVDRGGQPLWLGRSARLATPAQRRAITVRDGGCVFPGCEMPAHWCDVHHEPGWETGGASDLHTMVLLCRRHHGLAHTERWLLRPADPPDARPPNRSTATAPLPDHRFEWHDRRSGRTLPAAQRGLH